MLYFPSDKSMLFLAMSALRISIVVFILSLNVIITNSFHLSFGSRLFRADGQPIIRPLECRNALNNSEMGICMFSIDCMQNKGTPLSICKHNYFVGTCCRLPDQQNLGSIVYDLKETLPVNGPMMTTLSMNEQHTNEVVPSTVSSLIASSPQSSSSTSSASSTSGVRYSITTTTTSEPTESLSSLSTNGFERSDSIYSSVPSRSSPSPQSSSVSGQNDNLARFSYSVAPTTTLEATSDSNFYHKAPQRPITAATSTSEILSSIPDLSKQHHHHQSTFDSLTTPSVLSTSITNNNIAMSSTYDGPPNDTAMMMFSDGQSYKPSSSAPTYTEEVSQTTYFAEDDLRSSNISLNKMANNNYTKLLEQQKQSSDVATPQHHYPSSVSTTSASLSNDDIHSTQAFKYNTTTSKHNNYTTNGNYQKAPNNINGDNIVVDNSQTTNSNGPSTTSTEPEQRQSISVIVPNEIDSFQIQSTATVMPSMSSSSSYSAQSSTASFLSFASNEHQDSLDGNATTLDKFSQPNGLKPVAVVHSDHTASPSAPVSEVNSTLTNNYLTIPNDAKSTIQSSHKDQSSGQPVMATNSNTNDNRDYYSTSSTISNKEELISRPYSEPTAPTILSALQDSPETELYEQFHPSSSIQYNTKTTNLNSNLVKYEPIMPEGPIMSTKYPNFVSMSTMIMNVTTPSSYKSPTSHIDTISSDSVKFTMASIKLESKQNANPQSPTVLLPVLSVPNKDLTRNISNNYAASPIVQAINDEYQLSSDSERPTSDDPISHNLLTKVTVMSNHGSPTEPSSQQPAIQFSSIYNDNNKSTQQQASPTDRRTAVSNDIDKESSIGLISISSNPHTSAQPSSDSLFGQSTSASPSTTDQATRSTQSHYNQSDPSSPIYSLIPSTLLSSLLPSNSISSSSFTASLTTSSLPMIVTTTTQTPMSSSSVPTTSMMPSSTYSPADSTNNKQTTAQTFTKKDNITVELLGNSSMLVKNPIISTDHSSHVGGIVNNKIINYNINHNQLAHDSQRPLYNIYQPLHPATKIVPSNSMTSNNLIPGFGSLPSTLLSQIPFKISSFSTGLSNYLSSAIKPASRPLITSNTAPALQFLHQLAEQNQSSAQQSISNNNSTSTTSAPVQHLQPVKQSQANNSFIKFPGQSNNSIVNNSYLYSTSTSTSTTSTTTTTSKPYSSLDESISPDNLVVFDSQNTSSTGLFSVTTQDPVDMLDIMGKAKLICGRPQVPMARIVGGRKSNFGQWPWMVSLRQWRKGAFLHKCGAALLNEHWAITAAHCVEKVKANDLLLRLGEFDVSNQMEPYPFVEKRVKKIVSHPSFDPRTFEYDLALLRFSEPVKYQRNIVPVCVPSGNDSYVDRLATVIGWGRLYEDGPLPDVIQHVDVPIITNKECERMYKHAGYVEQIPDMFICAGISKGGKDSCEGDSGGPLTMIDHDGRSYLVGIISWGIGCALPSQPGVYTRITAFSDWINNQIDH